MKGYNWSNSGKAAEKEKLWKGNPISGYSTK
jgi:hypothetical protein